LTYSEDGITLPVRRVHETTIKPSPLRLTGIIESPLDDIMMARKEMEDQFIPNSRFRFIGTEGQRAAGADEDVVGGRVGATDEGEK
jgi:hypothetical protein